MARIHILGASGCGTTTLGAALALRLGCTHADADDAYWAPSEPPYQRSRPVAERLAWLDARIGMADRWVLSGSMVGWGDPLVPRIALMVFLTLDAETRLRRLQAREAARFGARIAPGGDMHQGHQAFLAWAAAYDTAGVDQRSRALHESWLADVGCPVLRLDGAQPREVLAEGVLSQLARQA